MLHEGVLLFAHPNPKSYNAAVLQTIQQALEQKKAEVKVKDLYAMNWDPLLSQSDFKAFHEAYRGVGSYPDDIKKEQDDIAWADAIVVVFPVWWYSVPAILKGYMDRVFSMGFAYKHTRKGPQGLLSGKKVLVISTSGEDEIGAKASGMIETIEKGLVKGVFSFCGFDECKYKNLFAVTVVSDQERQQMLAEVGELVKNFI